ncbi:SDR family NAD(P)-dependent oxidoreductase [Frankia sp. AgKG'84/4]|uniref:SDR family NAD(P)-dependent oxidoreductase n=1 Tax=Frankia sp. AgKG'84/4 TaxID=573490 RepID=UPI00200D226B|nr:SDR family oxidoreductase [Frankia sp. AgKG'84/4]MCL9795470.1 SDR family oxidoreductase [Frankia sp. AgKG'84/4]
MDAEKLRTLFDLTGRVAVITGGTRGIGRAIAEGFVAAGATVVVASRKADACAETEKHLRAMGGEALGVPAHVGDLADVRTLVERTVEAYGRLDIIVNNAATGLGQPIGSMTEAAMAKSFDVNTRGPVFLVQEALEHLKASPSAAIINVLSAGAFLHTPWLSTYAATKAALLAYTRAMAAELAQYGIRANALTPGAVDTDMVRATGTQSQERMANASHLRRIADADELVGPALLLASDAGSYITGQVLLVDGGLVVAR